MIFRPKSLNLVPRGTVVVGLSLSAIIVSCKGAPDAGSRLASKPNSKDPSDLQLYEPKGGDQINYEVRSKSWKAGEPEPTTWTIVDQEIGKILGLYKVEGDTTCRYRKETTYGSTQMKSVTDVCNNEATTCGSTKSKCGDATDLEAKTVGDYKDASGKKIACTVATPTVGVSGAKKVMIIYSETSSWTHSDAPESIVFSSTYSCSATVDDTGKPLDSYLTMDVCGSNSPDLSMTKTERELKAFTAGKGTDDYKTRPIAKLWIKGESEDARKATASSNLTIQKIGNLPPTISLSVSKYYCGKDADGHDALQMVSLSTMVPNKKASDEKLSPSSVMLLNGPSIYMSKDGCKYALDETQSASSFVSGQLSCANPLSLSTDASKTGELEAVEFTGIKPDGFGGGASGSAANNGTNNGTGTNNGAGTNNSESNGSSSDGTGTQQTSSGGSGPANGVLYGAGGPRGASFVLGSLADARKCAVNIAKASKDCAIYVRFGEIQATDLQPNFSVKGTHWCTCGEGGGVRLKDKLPWKGNPLRF